MLPTIKRLYPYRLYCDGIKMLGLCNFVLGVMAVLGGYLLEIEVTIIAPLLGIGIGMAINGAIIALMAFRASHNADQAVNLLAQDRIEERRWRRRTRNYHYHRQPHRIGVLRRQAKVLRRRYRKAAVLVAMREREGDSAKIRRRARGWRPCRGAAQECQDD